jgi:MFS family permease
MISSLRSTLKRLHPNVWILSLTSFLTDVSSEMILNLIPLFLLNVLGVRTSVVGLIEGIAETTASLIKIYSGSLSDRLRKRKRLAVIGYGLSSVAKPFLYFANTWSWVLGVRFSDRVGKGIRTAPRDALLAGSVAEERRGLAFGLHRAGDTAGAFTGLGIAALIVWFSQSNSELLDRKTFQIAVLASIIPGFLAVVILALGAKEVTIQRRTGAAPKSNLFSLGRSFQAFLFVVVLFTLGNSSDAFVILRGQERGLSVLQIMLMLLTFNAIYATLSGPAGSLSDRIDRRYLLLAGWFVYGLIYLGFGFARSGVQIWIFFGLYGIYYAMTEGTARALVADLTSEDLRGTAYGWYHAAVGITAFPASLIAGVLWQGIGSWQGFGATAPFYFGAAMALLAGVLFYLTVEAGSKQNPS